MQETSAPPQVDFAHLDQLWFQVGGTRCNLACTHCFISCHSKNHNFGFLSLDDVRARIEETVAFGVKEYYFTGGEPFLNPEMTEILQLALEYGPATVLTNATVFKEEWLQQLRSVEARSIYSLEFRVSIDGVCSKTNDPIRGAGTFERAMQGVSKLIEFDFMPIITAVRTWEMENEAQVIADFCDVLKSIGYTRPRIKILPTLKIGEEENRNAGYTETERVTPEMMQGFDQSLLVCHSSRTVTDRGVHVCPILIESPDSLLSQSVSESFVPFDLIHGACLTCYQYGSICANATGRGKENESFGKI